MKKILIILFMFVAIISNAQTLFPNKCIGNWKGIMQIFNNGVLIDTVTVLLTVKKETDTSWIWKTEYVSVKMPISKNYILRLINKTKNIYVTVEGNGILLKDHLCDNKLYSVFETEGIMLSSFYELRGKELHFEVTSGRKIVEIAKEVMNYSVNNIQKVTFKKIK